MTSHRPATPPLHRHTRHYTNSDVEKVWNTTVSPFGKGTASLNVWGCKGKQLGPYNCAAPKSTTPADVGVRVDTVPVIVCTDNGEDCGPKGPSCASSAFAWYLDAKGAAARVAPATVVAGSKQFALRSAAAAGDLCIGPRQHAPPTPPAPPPLPPFPDGGGAWNVVCNATAACPEGDTCCRLASDNWGCCTGQKNCLNLY